MRRSERLHPEVLALLEAAEAQGAPSIVSMTPAEARASRNRSIAAEGGAPVPLERVEHLAIPSPDGEIPARLYADAPGRDRSTLIYFHGGGFLLGNLDSHDSLCRAMAKQSGATVIAVDYRLAPEHKFPAAVEDAWAATTWVAARTSRLDLDATRLSVGGDSAGANLAAVVALRSRDRGGPALASQVLIYPVADLHRFDTQSYVAFAEGYGLTRAAMQWFGSHYLESPATALDPEASPLLAEDLSGLPPALVLTAEFDPLRDEGEAYAERLRQAGVPVTLTRYAGMTHGFVAAHGVLSVGAQAVGEIARFLEQAGRRL